MGDIGPQQVVYEVLPVREPAPEPVPAPPPRRTGRLAKLLKR